MVEGSTTVTADNLELPCPCASIPRLLAVFAVDGTKADVSSPNGYDWVSGREDASTRTARRGGWRGEGGSFLNNSLKKGRGQSCVHCIVHFVRIYIAVRNTGGGNINVFLA